jgi:hypothetical protein
MIGIGSLHLYMQLQILLDECTLDDDITEAVQDLMDRVFYKLEPEDRSILDREL